MVFAEDYVDVATRIAEFREKHPDGSLRALDPDHPYRIEQVEGQTYIVYAAAAYRTPDDPAPGVGVAWEYVPGKTPYTRGSELQNAETSAWGRAIVAAGAADTRKHGIASANEIDNRRAEQSDTGPAPRGGPPVCHLCGGSLAGALVEVVDGKKQHKGGCPKEAA